MWWRWRCFEDGYAGAEGCIRRCSRLVNEDTRCELWQGCHYKDEPPLNAPPKHADLRSHYIPSFLHTLRTVPYNIHSVSSGTMPLCTSHTYLPVYYGDTFEPFLHLLIRRGLFFGLQIYIWSICALNIFSENIFSSNFQVEYQPLSGLIWFHIEKPTIISRGRKAGGLWTNWAFPFCMRKQEREGFTVRKKSRREHW